MAFSMRQGFQLFLLLLLPLMTLLVGVTATAPAEQSNFFSFTNGVHNGDGWGQICYDLSLYTPTCGWHLILTSSHALSSIEVWDSDATKQDDHTFIMVNKPYNGDFSGPPPSCGSITLHGSFGNELPDIFVNYYCVCTTGSCEDVPYTTVGSSQTSTSAPILSTLAPTLYPGQTEENPSQIYLLKISNTCYTGSSKTTVNPVSLLSDCCSLCISSSACAGVNFMATDGQCDLVHADYDAGDLLFQSLNGCQYWDVVWKK